MSKKKDAEKAVVYQRIDLPNDPDDPMPYHISESKKAYDVWKTHHDGKKMAEGDRVAKENGIRAYLPAGVKDQIEIYDKKGKLMVRRDYVLRKEMNWTTLGAECLEKGVDLDKHWFYAAPLEFDYYPG
jgi:hypothetical protein